MVPKAGPAPVFLLSGTPGAGKSSVAAALMRRFPRGLHIPLDDLREWVVSGFAPPVPAWTTETSRQFYLARNAAAYMATSYSDAGFAVAVDDVLFPEDVEHHFDAPLAGRSVTCILLRPSLDVALTRNRERTNKAFDTSLLSEIIVRLYDLMRPDDFAARGWFVVDSGGRTVEETVEAILAFADGQAARGRI
jgi:chloramphenicol 3-O-phosphotransferase